MDRRDQELLDKQVARISPKRDDSILIALFVVALFAGMALGSVVFLPGGPTTSSETSVP